MISAEVKEMQDETIAAISTAYGPAGVGIIRISGDEAATIADKVFKSKSGVKIKDQDTYRITYGYIYDQDGQLIDEALALTMRGPFSFTGEDVVELQCHGGIVVLQKVLALALKAGARLAEPGEFSKRAFLNGRLDLAQAEGIMEMINAKTETGVSVAASHLQGRLSEEIKACRQDLLELISFLEADLDFPEEDFERLSNEEILRRLTKVTEKIKNILQSFMKGRIIREGLKVALVGKPNVGKSSLLNTLLKTKRAIVTDIPGTTRDTIEEFYNLGGIPLLLIDTAGIRDSDDLVEKIGVQKTKEIVEQADLVLYIFDLIQGITPEDQAYLSKIPSEKVLILVNKIDLLTDGAETTLRNIRERLPQFRVLLISATEQLGIQELEEEIKNIFFTEGWEIKDKAYLTNIRHKTALEKAEQALASAQKTLQTGLPLDLMVIDLKTVLGFLGEITGETVDEEIIDQIFSQFCLGK
ncbi:MAG: tRNA uridine-5-carboxymethylaminomethyl(34) synthesis GTPase MnmE [Clostridia bacterium]|jgi:tRNA modification GTPase|nr:tRNA uridine-5-carboxymethylaminomethyl(34) synthesis GTPase MnmE [Clostridia bacterium]